MSYSSVPKLQDKLICAVLYTGLFVPLMTWAPLIWVVITNVQKKHMPDFIKYHCYQAILFNMIAAFLPQLLSLLIDFTCNLLSLMVIFENTIGLLKTFNEWFLGTYSNLVKILVAYAIIWTLRGKYTYMPPISQAVNMMLR